MNVTTKMNLKHLKSALNILIWAFFYSFGNIKSSFRGLHNRIFNTIPKFQTNKPKSLLKKRPKHYFQRFGRFFGGFFIRLEISYFEL